MSKGIKRQKVQNVANRNVKSYKTLKGTKRRNLETKIGSQGPVMWLAPGVYH